jgi:hypothetical protein
MPWLLALLDRCWHEGARRGVLRCVLMGANPLHARCAEERPAPSPLSAIVAGGEGPLGYRVADAADDATR